MADASPETIKRLIENSEKLLSQIESSLPVILETRKNVVEAIKKQVECNGIIELMLVVLDSLLAENEVIYDISTSMDALLKATDNYTKHFYMQNLNLCFWEACQLFVGQKDDKNGLLQRLEFMCDQLHLVGCQFLINHVIEDIKTFREKYANGNLRNITRHYDHPIKMYEEIQKLDNIDFFGKGASQLMAIRMEISVISSYILGLLTPQRRELLRNVSPQKNRAVQIANEVVIEKLVDKDLKIQLQKVLGQGQHALDDCYRQYNCCRKATALLKEKELDIPNVFEKMESLILLRMESLFLRYDVACSVWGYVNASSEQERSQNLRLIHITKQAALTYIYGYTENARKKSLWKKIKTIEEADTENQDMKDVEKDLEELTKNLAEDNQTSRIYAHYRNKENFYIPDRLYAFGKMLHPKELEESLKLLNVCNGLEKYTLELLKCINKNQKQKRKKQYDEWMGKIDQLIAHKVKDKKIKDSVKPLRDIVEFVYGEKIRLKS